MHPIDEILTNRNRNPAMAKVISVNAAEGSCLVRLSDGPVHARLADHMLKVGSAAVVPGDMVALLPIGDTHLVIASVGSTAGTGGTAPLLGPNLLPNPSFEYGTDDHDGWAGWPQITEGVTVSRDTTPGGSLSGSARSMQVLPAGTGVTANTFTAAALMVDASKVYRVSAWVKASEATTALTCSLTVISGRNPAEADVGGLEYGDSGARAAGTTTTVATLVAPGSAYQIITGDVTIPSGHGYARLYLRSVSNHTATLTVSWDETSLQQRIA